MTNNCIYNIHSGDCNCKTLSMDHCLKPLVHSSQCKCAHIDSYPKDIKHWSRDDLEWGYVGLKHEVDYLEDSVKSLNKNFNVLETKVLALERLAKQIDIKLAEEIDYNGAAFNLHNFRLSELEKLSKETDRNLGAEIDDNCTRFTAHRMRLDVLESKVSNPNMFKCLQCQGFGILPISRETCPQCHGYGKVFTVA